MMRHVIIGSGVAALSAAEAIRGVDRASRITLVSDEAHPFYSRPGLAYFLAGTIPEKQLAIRSPAELAGLAIERVAGRAERVVPARHELRLAGARTLMYDRLLIATGARSIRPDFPGADLEGVLVLDGLDDARALASRAKRARAAVVAGGGSTALELVEGLHARGVSAHYFLRGERYWARVLDCEESALVEAGLVRAGVRVHRATAIARALGRHGRLVGVETNGGLRLDCDLVAVATGIRPRIELALDAGLAVDRGILVTSLLETSAPDVFAAGDVAQAWDPLVGESVLDTLWSSAAEQGSVAGLNMAGIRTPYRKRVALNLTRLADIITTVVGDVGGDPDPDLVTITRGQSEAWRGGSVGTSVVGRNATDRVRIRINSRTILGAVIMGDQTVSVPLTSLIADRVDITPIRQRLLDWPEAMVSTLLDFWRTTEARRNDGNPAPALVAV